MEWYPFKAEIFMAQKEDYWGRRWKKIAGATCLAVWSVFRDLFI